MKHIAIIGSGIGGLCTGIRLLAEGYQVSIYEKNKTAGGSVNRLTVPSQRFSWDESASLAINPSEYEAIFKDLGKDPREYFSWIKLKNSYHVFYEDQTMFKVPNETSKWLKKIANISPTDREGYEAFLYETDATYNTAKEKLLKKPLQTRRQIFNRETLATLRQTHPMQNVPLYLRRYIKDEKLIDFNLFQTFYMGANPRYMPGIYTAIAEKAQVEGIHHIKGGLSAYKASLLRLFKELGGLIYYQHHVTKIIDKQNDSPKFYVNQKWIKVDKIVINVDYSYALSELLGIKLRKKYQASCSTYVIHLGLDKCYDELNVHNLYITSNFREEIQRVFKGQMPENPNLYLYMPSGVDTSFCKKPHESVLNIMVRVPNLKKYSGWDKESERQLFIKCLENVRKIKGLEDLQRHICSCMITQPTTFEMRYHATDGGCFGLAHTYTQSLMFRPQVQLKKYKNIYFTGASVHPGNGVSIVMMGAQLTANQILSDDKNE